MWEDISGVPTGRPDLDGRYGFGSTFAPLSAHAVAQAEIGVPDDLAYLPEHAHHQLLTTLDGICSPALLELFRADPGDYRTFTRGVVSDRWRSVRDAYPMLDALVVLVVDRWVEVTRELAVRLHLDRDLLVWAFGFDATGVRWVSKRLGDPHRGGRCVVALEDQRGRRVVYKPRSTAPEQLVGHTIARIARRAPHLVGDHQPVVLDRTDPEGGAYGWMSWVDGDVPCAADELTDFYRRAGALAAVARVLGLSDLHHENLVATGSTPVVVDCECVLTPRLVRGGGPEDPGLQQVLGDSVLPSGLLPGSVPGLGPVVADRAGLTGRGGAVTGNWGRHWVGLGTDDIDLVPRPLRTPPSRNRPLPHRTGRRALVPTEAVVDGYRQAADLLAGLPVPDDEVAAVRPRILFRSTSCYSAVYQKLIDPETLTDRRRFDQVLEGDHEWNAAFDELGPATSDRRRWQDALVADERRSLRHLDIPAFSFDPSTGTVVLDGTPYAGLFVEAPVEGLHRRWRALGAPGDGERQSAIARLALQGHRGGTLPERPRPDIAPGAVVDADEARDVAREIVDDIVASTIEVDGAPRWLVTRMMPNTTTLGPWLTDGGLYRGSSGIALVLALAARHLGGTPHSGPGELVSLAKRAFDHGLELLGADGSVLARFQLESGRSGWSYAAAVVAASSGDEELARHAAAVALPPVVEIGRSDSLDLLSGWAGVVLAAAAVAETLGDVDLARRAAGAADTLAEAIVERDGVGATAPHRRLGMGHGVFGVILALERAGHPGSAAHRLAEELSRSAQQRIAARDHVPGRIHRHQHPPAVDTSWCWGTTGYVAAATGRARPRFADDDALATGVHHAAWASSAIDRLCCGSAGRIAALASAGHHGDAARLAAGLVARWRTGTLVGDRGTEVVDATLFRGLAGIAYALMTVLTPVPNVLALEPGDPSPPASVRPRGAGGHRATPAGEAASGTQPPRTHSGSSTAASAEPIRRSAS